MLSNCLYRILYQLFFFNPPFLSDGFIEDLGEVNETIPVFAGTMKTEFFKMGLSLLLLLVVFGVCVWAFKKFLKKGGQCFNKKSSAIKILDQRTLSHKSTLYLIQVVDKTLIIAESSDQIEMLSEFPQNTDLKLAMNALTDKKNGKTNPGDFISKTIKILGKKLSHS